jgi:predicted dehydrogenase
LTHPTPSTTQIPPASSSAGQHRIAIIGCGAVVEAYHLPASIFAPRLSIEVLVDRDERRAKALAAAYGIPRVSDNHRTIIGDVDAAIIALPHSLNARVAGELLGEGISVLVEKPMAVSAAQAQELLSASDVRGASLRVGYTRRCGYGVEFVRRALRENLLGTITGFSVEDGYPFNWRSAAQEFRFEKYSGGGLLMDIGCHVFDMLIYWFGPLFVRSSFDDAIGGVEVNAIVELETQNGIPGTVELSWERVLRNSAIIEGTAGRLEIEWYKNNAALYFSGNALRGSVGPGRSDMPLQTFDMMFVEQLKRWTSVLDGGSEECSLADGREGMEVLSLVENCRRLGGVLQLPWMAV